MNKGYLVEMINFVYGSLLHVEAIELKDGILLVTPTGNRVLRSLHDWHAALNKLTGRNDLCGCFGWINC